MKRRLAELIEELNDGFCSVRLSGELVYANISAKNLLKLEEDQTYNFFDAFIRDPNRVESIKNAIENEKISKDIECDLFNSRNEKFPVILTVNVIRDIDDDVIGMAILFKDMSDLKEMHFQLLQAQKMESIGLLASGIAHEFNNLLSGILPNAELIKMTVDSNDANHARADSIYKSAKRAGNIVKQLLSFARHDQIEENVSLNLNVAVSETLDIMGKLFGREVKVENKLPIHLPLIKIDPTRMQQIIMNLAINARDALEGPGRIVFSAKPVHVNNQSSNGLHMGNYVRLSVRDNGKGINKEHLERIFDPFFTTKEPGKGTGLGLSTVYGIMKNVKGEIKVYSEVGKGTRFDLYFPVSESAVVLQKVTEFQKDETDFSKDPREKTILIVDDEPVILDMAKDMLNYIGYKTISASSAIEAVKLYKESENSIDLVMIDLLMPKVNGISCFKEIRKINNSVPVIITSGVGEANKRKDMLKMGAVEYLQKPYDVKTFTRVFENIF